MNLNETGERLSELGNEWEIECAREEPDVRVLNEIVASYAFYAGALYGLAYRQSKAIKEAENAVRQTMDVIDGFLSVRTEDKT
jgi:hypothetical protein